MNAEIGKRIKEARERANMSQRELAARIGVSQALVNKYEAGGVSNMPIDRLKQIADITGVDPLWLFCAEEQIFQNELLAAVKRLGADERKQVLNYVRFLAAEQG